MTKKRYTLTVLFLIGASCSFAAVPVTVEVIEVNKIWDKAPHNAFTDLARWNDIFYCAFREGRGHVSTDGKIRILESKDTNRWDSAALIALAGYDLRDAHLSVTPDGRLMLLGGAAPRKKDNQSAPTGTFVSFSQDGKRWTKPQIVVQPGRWLWCVTWNKAKAYGVSYTAGKGTRHLDLLVSNDGINYEPHIAKLFEQGYPTEVTLRFDTNGTCYAIVRRDRHGTDSSTALLGISKPNYKHWQFKDLGTDFNGFGGPNLIQIPGGHWIAAGRMHQGGAHTALTYIDVAKGTMTKLTKLPSGGDTSYPGLVWHNDLLYVSYYSSHEGKTSIYLAKVRVKPNVAAQDETFGAEPNPTGNPIGGGKGYQRLVGHSDYQVKTSEELLAALKQAKAGQIVYVDDKVEIDLTGRQKIVIPAGVTVASGRGKGNSQGALLYSNELATSPLFSVGGENVRITGLRLRGPDQQRRTEQMRKLHKEGRYYSIPNSDAIICAHPHLEVDNCELWGWSHAAVSLGPGASKAHIHHNYIHHNQRSGLGYGVSLHQADALIECNLFDWCRHHIAGTGRPSTSYEARYNLVLANANSHSFDMHGARDFEKRLLNAHWRFEEGKGFIARDTSIYPHNNNGTLMNMDANTCWVKGKIGQALKFDGEDDYVDCGNDNSLSPAKGLTIMAWVKPAILSGVQTILSKGHTGTQASGYNLRLTNDQIETTVYDSRGNIQTTLSGNLQVDNWYHIAIAHNGSRVSIYINAILVNSFACNGIKHSQLNFIMGKNSNDDTSHFKGLIDEVRLYNRAMSKEDIERNYNGNGDIAGDWIKIHHNTFRATGVRAIVIRGRPAQSAEIHHNWFLHSDPQKAIVQTNATGNMNVGPNQFTTARTPAGGEKEDKKPSGKEFPPEIVDFAAYPGNPLFGGTGSDTWDRKIRERGYILREANTYHLWYTGYNKNRSKTMYLGYATSRDGLKWTRHPDNPIFDESWVEDMHVVKHGQTYYMFAEGFHDIAHMLTSTDRVHWHDQSSLDIRYTTGEHLSPGPYGTPTIWVEGKTWYLFYERGDLGIWLATSTDRKVWKNVQDDPVINIGPEAYDRHAVALNQIIKYKGRYYGYYHASAYRPWRDWTTNVAVSTDLVHWKKYSKNPILTGNKSSGILVHDGNQYRLYTMHPDVRVYFPGDSQ